MVKIIVGIIIFILLLFLPIELTFSKSNTTIVNARILFISFKIPKLKGKGIDVRKIKSNVSPFYFGVKYLLGYSKIKITSFEFLTVNELSEKPYLSTTKFIVISSLLAFIAANSKEYDYSAQRYIVTEKNDNSVPNITVKVNFLLFRLIISLILVAYYKIKNAIGVRKKYV